MAMENDFGDRGNHACGMPNKRIYLRNRSAKWVEIIHDFRRIYDIRYTGKNGRRNELHYLLRQFCRRIIYFVRLGETMRIKRPTEWRRLRPSETVRKGDQNATTIDGPWTDVGAIGFPAGEIPELHFRRRIPSDKRGRPAMEPSDRLCNVNLRMPAEMRDQVDQVARDHGISRGAWARKIIAEALKCS